MRKTIYSPRVIYNPKTDETAIYKWNVRYGKIQTWFFYDGKEVKKLTGKLKYPKGFIEVVWFSEGEL